MPKIRVLVVDDAVVFRRLVAEELLQAAVRMCNQASAPGPIATTK